MDEPVKTAFVVVKNLNGRIALIQEGGQQARGLWCLPGGHVDKGETVEHAAIREVKEEAGLDVAINKSITSMIVDGLSYRGDISDNDRKIEVNIFAAAPVDETADHGIEELDARWCTKDEIKALDLRWAFLKDLLLTV